MTNLKKMLHKYLPFSVFLKLKLIDFNLYRYIITPLVYPFIKNKLSGIRIASKFTTAKELANSNKSLSRYGDGEIQWMLDEKEGSFEKESPLLIKRLSQIIKNNDRNFMVALPDAFSSINQFNDRSEKLWGRFIVKYSVKTLPYLNKNSYYYNTSVVRPYIDYRNRTYAGKVFNELKKIWNGKNILIVEGSETRLGVGNNLFNNANNIKRIECPRDCAFESYDKILDSIITFLKSHKNSHYITLLSLGPTATIMSYDVYKQGYRAIDIGHIDLEYSWYLMKVKKPVNIPYKYVNEMDYDKKPTKKLSLLRQKGILNRNGYIKEIIDKI